MSHKLLTSGPGLDVNNYLQYFFALHFNVFLIVFFITAKILKFVIYKLEKRWVVLLFLNYLGDFGIKH